MPGSPWATAAAPDAVEELVVNALSVTHGLGGTAVTGAGAATTVVAGATAIATVETVQSETAIATTVNLRAKPNIKKIPPENASVSPFWLHFPPRNPNAATEVVAIHPIWTVFGRVWPKGRHAASASRPPLRFL